MAGSLNIGTVLVKLLLDDGQFGPDMKKAETAMSNFGAKAVDIAGTVDKYITRAFAAAAAAVAALGTAAVVTGAGFEQQMSRVAAVSGATAEEMAALTKEARRIGSETMFSATQAAQGMEALAQAGFTPRQVIAATADAMNLAGASGMELNAATETVAATLTQFGMKAEEAGRASDVLTQAASSSLFTVQDLSVALRYAGSAGAAMGYSLEETTAAVAQFRNMGLVGEVAGTNFRAMMEGIANPTKKAREEIEAMGLKVEDLDPTMNSFDQIMQRLYDHNLSVSSSFKIFGTVAGANVRRLASTWDEAKRSQTGYGNTLDALLNSQGVAAAQFGRMADNVAGKFDVLSSSVEDGLLTVFDAMKGPLVRLMDEITQRVGFLTKKFSDGSGTVEDGLNQIVDAIIAVVDQLIILSPYLEEVSALMFAALVGAKGVQWAGAIAGLAKAFGVDLAQAAMKAVTAIRAASVASAAFTVTGVGAAIAGIALLVAAVAKLAAQYTGATKAARELAGELAGQRNLDEQAKRDQAALGEVLAAQQAEIRARLERGEVLNAEENQILRLTAATAYQMQTNGELLNVGQRLALAEKMSIEDRKDQITILREQADRARTAASELGALADQYHEIGAFDALNDKWNDLNGVLQRASVYAGRQVTSLEDLKAAQAELAGQAERSKRSIDGLTAGIDETRIAANEEAAARAAAVPPTEKLADANDRLAAASEKAADKTAKFWDDVRDDVAELSDLVDVLGETMGPKLENLLDVVVAQQTVAGLEKLVEAVEYAYTDVVAQNSAAAASALLDEIGSGSYALKLVGNALTGVFENAARSLGDAVRRHAGRAVNSILSTLTAGLGSVSGITGLVGDLIAGRSDAKGGTADARAALREARKSGNRADIRKARMGLSSAQQAEKGTTGASLVDAAADAAITFVTTLAEELPGIFDAIIKRVPDIANALIAAIPMIFQSLADALPGLITAIGEQVPALIAALRDGIVKLLIASPLILEAILEQIPAIIVAIVDSIPVIITALVEAIPSLIGVLIKELPRIGLELLLIGPKLIVGMIREIASGRLFASLWRGLKELAKDFGALVLDVLSFGITGLFRKKDKKEDKTGIAGLFQDIGGLFSKKGRNRHPDGIPYVPHTMTTVLEPGEAVLSAIDNWERRRTNFGTPGPLPRGGGAQSVEVVVAWDGTVVDAAQSRSMADGRMPRTRRAMRSAAKASRIGFSKGPLSTRG